jgi:hypothetical protein
MARIIQFINPNLNKRILEYSKIDIIRKFGLPRCLPRKDNHDKGGVEEKI